MTSTKGKMIKCRAPVIWEYNKPITFEDIEVLPPVKREVRIKVVSTGVCHTDISGWQGTASHLQLPLILGHEGAGIVESVGEEVTTLKEGDHVLVFVMPHCQECHLCKSNAYNFCEKFFPSPETDADKPPKFLCKGKTIHPFLNAGTYSEYTVLEEFLLVKVPKEAPLDKICLLSCGVTTGYGSAVNKAKVKPGSTCVVFGLGTVGLAAAMGCKNQGAKRIIGVDINNGKKEIAKTFGVTEFLNPTKLDKPIDALLMEKTQGGCDYAFECVGSVEVINSALKSCRIGGGQCTIIGAAPMGDTVSIDPYQILFGRELNGGVLGNYRLNEIPSLVDDYMKKKILLDEFITDTYPMTEITKAFETSGKGSSVKTMLSF